MNIDKCNAINSLGNWNFKIIDNDLSQITHYDNNGSEISKPTDFPSDADINARQADMQTKADTGTYDSIQAIIATYNA